MDESSQEPQAKSNPKLPSCERGMAQVLVGVGTWRWPGGKRGAVVWRGYDSAGRNYCTDLIAEPKEKQSLTVYVLLES